jgi:tetratricopeptide (TPR) repeat protein
MRRCLPYVAIIVGLALTATLAAGVAARPATGPTDAMVAANRLYEAGSYAEAASMYQQLVDAGYVDSAVFYNLGNAYFKVGEIGRAILNYRRAEVLAPRDADVRANLAVARGLAVDQLQSSGPSVLAQLSQLSARWLTLNELAALALALWVVLFLLLALFLFSRRGSHLREAAMYLVVLVGLLVLAAGLTLGSRLYLVQSRPDAVIVAVETDVTSGPGSQYVVEFNLHTGAEVVQLEQRGSWTRLALPGSDLQGWAPSSDVEVIGQW